MNFEQPESEENINENKKEIVEETKNLSEIDKEDLSQVYETKEFQEITDLYNKGIDLMESRQKADGLGILSKVGLNKDFKLINEEFEKLTNELKEKKEKLREEIGLKEPFFEFFITTGVQKKFVEKMNKEERDNSSKG